MTVSAAEVSLQNRFGRIGVVMAGCRVAFYARPGSRYDGIGSL
jgi:hypothetical protein